MTITRDELVRMFPRARAEYLEAFLETFGPLAEHAKINTPLRCKMFISQIGAETNGLALKSMKENIRYSASRAAKVFSYRLRRARTRSPWSAKYGHYRSNLSLARHLCRGNRHALMNVVYGGRGGTPYNLGWKYIGRGFTQTTHLSNYRKTTEYIRKQPGGENCPDLVEDPDALLEPEWAVRAAYADWMMKGVNKTSDTGSLYKVRKHINCGSPNAKFAPNGMSHAKRWYKRAGYVDWDAVLARDVEPQSETESEDEFAPKPPKGGVVETAKEVGEILVKSRTVRGAGGTMAGGGAIAVSKAAQKEAPADPVLNTAKDVGDQVTAYRDAFQPIRDLVTAIWPDNLADVTMLFAWIVIAGGLYAIYRRVKDELDGTHSGSDVEEED